MPVNKATKISSLSVPVFSLAGKADGVIALPKEVFGVAVNNQLLAQAVRVYTTNRKVITASTKTRGQVVASTAKIYAQKGTGRARHGANSAPIFVGGGIAFGPKPRKVTLDLPKRMKKAALLSALSSKVVDKKTFGLSGAEKATGKTKEFATVLAKISDKKQTDSTLVVTGGKMDNVLQGIKNIPGVRTLPVNLLNAYEVLRHDILVLTKEAVARLENKDQLNSGHKIQSEESSSTSKAKKEVKTGLSKTKK